MNFYVIKYNYSEDKLGKLSENPFYDSFGQRTWTSQEESDEAAVHRFMVWNGQELFVKIHSVTIRDYYTRSRVVL
jgi:hypothetical protein